MKAAWGLRQKVMVNLDWNSARDSEKWVCTDYFTSVVWTWKGQKMELRAENFMNYEVIKKGYIFG